MSFSSEVKKELCFLDVSTKSEIDALLYGMLYSFRNISKDEISMPTENMDAVKLLSRLVSENFLNVNYEIKTIVKKPRSLHTFRIFEKNSIKILNDKYKLLESSINTDIVSGNDTLTGYFLRGIFLLCGSITDPKKDYHIEFSIYNPQKAESLFNLINEQGISIKRTNRKGVPLLYAKESENIEDILTYIGAVQHSLEIMNVKIYKDFRNRVNRTVNCENANLDKIVEASQKQTNDIEFIFERKGKSYLKPELEELALLRLNNPEMSLRELGEKLLSPLSRSGVNHRLKKITEIAEELRQEDY